MPSQSALEAEVVSTLYALAAMDDGEAYAIIGQLNAEGVGVVAAGFRALIHLAEDDLKNIQPEPWWKFVLLSTLRRRLNEAERMRG